MIRWLTSGATLVQTISARCYVNRHRPVWGSVYRVINKIFFWQTDHCRESHKSDVEFARQILFGEWVKSCLRDRIEIPFTASPTLSELIHD